MTFSSTPLPSPAGSPNVRRLVLLSLAWACLGTAIAELAPWTGLTDAPLAQLANSMPLAITAGLIAWNLIASIRLVGRTGHALSALPLTLTQLVLFTLLFFQISCHLGAEHYDWPAPPRWWHWLAFSGDHLLRAADLLDIIEAYGWNLQPIQHQGHLPAVSLIAYNLIVSTFLIVLLLEWWERGKRALLRQPAVARQVGDAGRCLLAFWLVGWLATALWLRPWRGQDIFLWPMDNLLRVLDFMDAMEIYQVRLHQVPPLAWEGTLTVLCRLSLALALAGILSRLSRTFRLRCLGGFGMSAEELEDVRDHHASAALRQKAEQRLAQLARSGGLTRTAAAWLSLETLGAVLLGVMFMLLGIISLTVLPGGNEAIPGLVMAATGPDETASANARAALRRMGSTAGSAVPDLDQAQRQAPRKRRLALIDTMGYLGSAAVGPLAALMLDETDEEVSLQAVAALRQVGPRATAALVPGLTAPRHRVREAVRGVVLGFGSAAVQPLMDALSAAHAAALLPLIEQLDPYWDGRSSANKYCQEVLRIYPRLMELRKLLPAGTFGQRQDAARELGQLGPVAAVAVPALIERLADEDLYVRQAALEGLGGIGPAAAPAVPAVTAFLANHGESFRIQAVRVLGGIGPAAAPAVPALVERLTEPAALMRQSVIETLGAIGPAAARAVPAVAECMTDADLSVRIAVFDTLVRIGPASVPVLRERLLSEADENCARAARALGQLAAASAVPELVASLKHPDDGVRRAVVTALGRIGPPAGRTVPALIPLLKDRDRQVRQTTAEVLGQFGPKAASAIALLEKVEADDSYREVREAAAEALRKIRATSP